MAKIYPVDLTDEERENLLHLILLFSFWLPQRGEVCRASRGNREPGTVNREAGNVACSAF